MNSTVSLRLKRSQADRFGHGDTGTLRLQQTLALALAAALQQTLNLNTAIKLNKHMMALAEFTGNLARRRLGLGQIDNVPLSIRVKVGSRYLW